MKKPTMKNKSTFSIINKHNNFVVTKNGEPVKIQLTTDSSIEASFFTRDEAYKYLVILKRLSQSKIYGG